MHNEACGCEEECKGTTDAEKRIKFFFFFFCTNNSNNTHKKKKKEKGKKSLNQNKKNKKYITTIFFFLKRYFAYCFTQVWIFIVFFFLQCLWFFVDIY